MKELRVIRNLSQGAHLDPRDGHCALEAAAYVAREPHSDHPECVSPTISDFLRTWNDTLPSDEERNRLLIPLIPEIIGTGGTLTHERQRREMVLNWALREYTPAWLRLAGLISHADAVSALPSWANLSAARAAARAAAWAAAGDAARAAARAAARDAAGAAARAAAWDAAGDAAGAAAGAAAWAAAGDAAGDAAWAAAGAAAWAAAWDAAWAAARAAARDTAGAAAWAAARDAARAAARAAAGDALAPTVLQLQESALRLVRRMVAVKPGPGLPMDYVQEILDGVREPGPIEITGEVK